MPQTENQWASQNAQTSASTEVQAPSVVAFEQIPIEVLREHYGKWIIWDQDAGCLLGVGVTLEEAEHGAQEAPAGHLLRFHHAFWDDVRTPAGKN